MIHVCHSVLNFSLYWSYIIIRQYPLIRVLIRLGNLLYAVWVLHIIYIIIEETWDLYLFISINNDDYFIKISEWLGIFNLLFFLICPYRFLWDGIAQRVSNTNKYPTSSLLGLLTFFIQSTARLLYNGLIPTQINSLVITIKESINK